jgi:hypothetical protein
MARISQSTLTAAVALTATRGPVGTISPGQSATTIKTIIKTAIA